MSKIYKIHKWLSIVSVLFFLMFCITGLVLMFRTELNAWAQGGSHHSSLSMEMSQQEMSIFNYADEGALLVLSLIHIPSPRDRQKSRMPSSA